MSSLLHLASSNSSAEVPGYVGFTAAGVAVVFYGSNFVPVKQYDTQDGMTFQLCMCTAIWLVGLAVQAARNFPQMHAPVLLGGAMWATGNLCVVPIIQTIGMGLGILVWGTVNMLSGWASGRFGVFGIAPQLPDRPILNYIGVALSVLASSVVFFVTPETGCSEASEQISREVAAAAAGGGSDQQEGISIYDDAIMGFPSVNQLASGLDTQLLGSDTQVGHTGPFWLRMSQIKRKVFGGTLAVLSGLAYGLAFVPTYYVQAHVPDASLEGLDYVFTHFTGILSASSLYFCLYAAVQRNQPSVNPKCMLPAFVSGAMWGIATAAWFLANQTLSESVAFPIITTAPIVVAALWSVLVFHEIRGARNLLLLSLTFATTATGSVLNGLSR